MRETLQKVRSQLTQLQARIEELTAVVDAALNAEPTPGENAKRLLDFFVKHWERKHPGQKYVVNGAKDMASLKRLLKQLDAEDLAERVRRYFKTADAFVIEQRHPLGLFVSGINKYAGETAAPLFAPRNCSHTPACRDDAECTRKRLREERHV